MAWEHLSVDKPHLVYIILGGFTSLFMLCSSLIKEKLYIGEATVATICGIIFGPHAANLIDPSTWGNEDRITLEFSRIVLVVQCFAVGVELPKFYMERHWRSVTLLLIPVMTFGWLVTSLFIWALIPPLNWLDSLCCAACVTATDPVLASSVVGKGKFAQRVPKHLRDLLSAESGCNDGMAFPFIYLAIYIIRYHHHPNEVALEWFCVSILYECVFGAIYGVIVGYIARHAVRFAHERNLIDRESFLVFYFVLALFCAGSGSILGMDDLLVGFACGVGFSNDGWFTEKTEESHVSNVIDLLINLAFFVYFGTIIPWAQFDSAVIGLSAWRLVVLAILVLLFRRIPIMLALKPFIPDIKTWREALFAGHFGPIGVGAIFVAILARAELETESTTPLGELPEAGFEHLNIIELIWPITTFLVITSILVHGSSIAVFTLGKHINTLTLTMSYTQGNDQSWMDRLPRIQSRSKTSMSQQRPDDTDESLEEKGEYGAFPPNFLRRQREDDTPARPLSRRRSRKSQYGAGGPISQSAIRPQRSESEKLEESTSRSESDASPNAANGKPPLGPAKRDDDEPDEPGEPEGEVYEEGGETVYEDEEGNVLAVKKTHEGDTDKQREARERDELKKLMRDQDVHHGVARRKDYHAENEDEDGAVMHEFKKDIEHPQREWRKKMAHLGGLRKKEDHAEKSTPKKSAPKRGPARAYQFGNTIIVEDEDGEVLKKYDIEAPSKKPKQAKEGEAGASSDAAKPAGPTRRGLARMGTALSITGRKADETEQGSSNARDEKRRKKAEQEAEDDDRLRFSVAGGQRMSKAEFVRQISSLNAKQRASLVEESDLPEAIKREAREGAKKGHEDSIPHRLESLPANRPVRLHSRDTATNLKGQSPAENGQSDLTDNAKVKRMPSHTDAPSGPEGLTLVDSNDEVVPFHDVTGDLRRSSGAGETPAEKRRREARERAEQSRQDTIEEDSEDDGTARVPPSRPEGERYPSDIESETAAERRRREGALAQGTEDGPGADYFTRPRDVRVASGSARPRKSRLDSDTEGETAAERRRREGALGITQEDESDSEDEDNAPRQPPTNIRFAEPQKPQQAATSSSGPTSRLRWGKNRKG
ncbi:Na+/H+ antiporter [Aureobasidium sp. EXF-10728]|nr:Na+/H+ antiporter [Aureobasidium sp. EXF-10728]